VGAGEHRRLQEEPYIFSRTLETEEVSDRVLVAMDQGEGAKTIPVFGVFPNGRTVLDAYSGESATVTGGQVTLVTGSGLVLLSERR
jgi:alpha-amylase